MLLSKRSEFIDSSLDIKDVRLPNENVSRSKKEGPRRFIAEEESQLDIRIRPVTSHQRKRLQFREYQDITEFKFGRKKKQDLSYENERFLQGSMEPKRPQSSYRPSSRNFENRHLYLCQRQRGLGVDQFLGNISKSRNNSGENKDKVKRKNENMKNRLKSGSRKSSGNVRKTSKESSEKRNKISDVQKKRSFMLRNKKQVQSYVNIALDYSESNMNDSEKSTKRKEGLEKNIKNGHMKKTITRGTSTEILNRGRLIIPETVDQCKTGMKRVVMENFGATESKHHQIITYMPQSTNEIVSGRNIQSEQNSRKNENVETGTEILIRGEHWQAASTDSNDHVKPPQMNEEVFGYKKESASLDVPPQMNHVKLVPPSQSLSSSRSAANPRKSKQNEKEIPDISSGNEPSLVKMVPSLNELQLGSPVPISHRFSQASQEKDNTSALNSELKKMDNNTNLSPQNTPKKLDIVADSRFNSSRAPPVEDIFIRNVELSSYAQNISFFIVRDLGKTQNSKLSLLERTAITNDETLPSSLSKNMNSNIILNISKPEPPVVSSKNEKKIPQPIETIQPKSQVEIIEIDLENLKRNEFLHRANIRERFEASQERNTAQVFSLAREFKRIERQGYKSIGKTKLSSTPCFPDSNEMIFCLARVVHIMIRSHLKKGNRSLALKFESADKDDTLFIEKLFCNRQDQKTLTEKISKRNSIETKHALLRLNTDLFPNSKTGVMHSFSDEQGSTPQLTTERLLDNTGPMEGDEKYLDDPNKKEEDRFQGELRSQDINLAVGQNSTKYYVEEFPGSLHSIDPQMQKYQQFRQKKVPFSEMDGSKVETLNSEDKQEQARNKIFSNIKKDLNMINEKTMEEAELILGCQVEHINAHEVGIDVLKRNKKMIDDEIRVLRDKSRFLKLFDDENYEDSMKGMPKIGEIKNFISNIFFSCRLVRQTLITSIVYIERLVFFSSIDFTPKNWRRLLMIALIVSSKVWDDESLENHQFAKILAQFETRGINQMEKEFLERIEYDLEVCIETYTRYYFHLKTHSTPNACNPKPKFLTFDEIKKNKKLQTKDKALSKAFNKRRNSFDFVI